jgi:predicted RNase H-like HicB family nuclease
MRFTAIIERDEDGIYVGQIEEVPAAICQGQTLEELRENFQDALELIFSVNRDEVEANYQGKIFFKEKITISSLSATN